MRNFVQDGNVLTLVVAQGGVSSGHPIIVGSIFGIAAHDALQYAEVEVHVVGVFDLPKAAGVVNQGARVWWDDTAKVVKNATGAGLFPIGVAVKDAGDTDTTCRVRLDGIAVVAAGA